MTSKQKRNLIRILASAALFGTSFFIPEGVLSGYLGPALTVAAYVAVGYDVIWDAVLNILNLKFFDEKFLMLIATVGAFALGELAEAAAVMLFYQVGELFQSLAVGKSRRAVKALLSLRPDTARVLRGGEEKELTPEEIAAGEEIIVRPGEKIPLDGIIIKGKTDLNTAALTGESLPREVDMGDRALAGSVSLTGVVHLKVEKEYSESAVAKILELVSSSSSKKARAEKFITRFARVYTPIVVMAALALAFIPPLCFGLNLAEWGGRALVFLVLSCPCALVISVPLSFFGGIGGASREGILVKGAGYLEELSHIDTVAFDKTGTLTEGKFSVSQIIAASEKSCNNHKIGYTKAQRELLRIAGLLELNSEHPIGKCIQEFAKNELKDEFYGSVDDVTVVAGRGITAIVDGIRAYAGSLKFMEESGVAVMSSKLSGSVVYVGYNGGFLGAISVDDRLKDNAKEVISSLKSAGVKKTLMLTGDTRERAEKSAELLGVDEYRAELLPKDKTDILEELISEGGRVAFVGDGINDAPTLMLASVGIAMGGIGSDAAIESADVVIMDDKLSKLPRAIRIAKKTMSIVNGNIIFALSVKLIILILGALGYANMWLAVFGDVGVMIIAILNSLRTLRKIK